MGARYTMTLANFFAFLYTYKFKQNVYKLNEVDINWHSRSSKS